ncbi:MULTISPECIES: selenium binding protein [Allobaculum]|uniref:selenium binding protein n=2 Tax=Erysipelotrichaceae TaxID=128827 RepID=UPI001E5FD4CB|nr:MULTISPECIES: selenium binding protein [Allobaculum]UNT96055.1 selenium binding protein [Allobaculum mucilyticum]
MYMIQYTHQSLPDEEYCLLLGISISVFNSNNGFMIENILRLDPTKDWHSLIDKESGKIKQEMSCFLNSEVEEEITNLFSDIVEKRNRIIHSFRITNQYGEQSLATKSKNRDGGVQFEITKKYLQDFIKENDVLSSKLHELRGF